MLVSCSEQRTSNAPNKAIFPHADDWVSGHILYVTENQTGVRQSCVSCHQSYGLRAARSLGPTIGCGDTCHEKFDPANPLASTGDFRMKVFENACLKCHGSPHDRPVNHYPAQAGLCIACHRAEESHLRAEDRHAVVTLPPEDSCFICHSTNNHSNVFHTPMDEKKKCASCHAPHGADFRKILKVDTPQLCLNCHQNMVHQARRVHLNSKAKGDCSNCHAPDSSKLKVDIQMTKPQLCLSCHGHEIADTNNFGRSISNISKKVNPDRNITPDASVHRATTLSCNDTCHRFHDSGFDRLLASKFPLTNFNEFSSDPNMYALCFQCHSNKLLNSDAPEDVVKYGASETKFFDFKSVDGQLKKINLHRLHVIRDKGVKNGHSCILCHDPHGSIQKSLIHTTWKMGTWDADLKYSQAPDGGTCATACHIEKTYRRRIDTSPTE